MFSKSLPSTLTSSMAGFIACVTLSSAALAQTNNTSAAAQPATQTATPSAPTPPKPNPEAENALEQHFRMLYWALQGKRAAPEAKNFTESFNKQITTEQLQKVFEQAHQNLGNCSLAGKVQSPVSYVGSYLLQCTKGYVPMDIAIEETAPYRVHSLLIRPAYVSPNQ